MRNSDPSVTATQPFLLLKINHAEMKPEIQVATIRKTANWAVPSLGFETDAA